MEIEPLVLTGLRPHRVHRIVEASQIGSLRRDVAEMARTLGINTETAGRAAIVATELGTNLVKHATHGGEVLLRPMALGATAGIEFLAVDAGPGMADAARMREDGVSTAGSPGTGFGAMQRLSDEFAVYSAPQVGTAVLSRMYNRLPFDRIRLPPFAWGVVNLAKPGEEVCGDGWSIVMAKGRILVLVADGLGHGPGASAAAQEAVRAFVEPSDMGPDELVRKLHPRLRATRGAAVAIAEIDPGRESLTYVGVGNIFGRIIRPGEKARSLVSMNGTLGYELRKVQPFFYPWHRDSTLVMNSDGLLSRWDAQAYDGLSGQHPALIAVMAYRDRNRGSDDLTVVGLRLAER